MIKKNKQGKVVEFENEDAMSRVNGSKGDKPASASPAGENILWTEELALGEYEAAVKAATEAHTAALKASTEAAMVEVTKLDVIAAHLKEDARKARKRLIADAESECRSIVAQVESEFQKELEEIWSRYRTNMQPVNDGLTTAKTAANEALEAARRSLVCTCSSRGWWLRRGGSARTASRTSRTP